MSIEKAVKIIKKAINKEEYIVVNEIEFGAYKAMITFERYHSFFDNGTVLIYLEDETAYGYYLMPVEQFSDYTDKDIEKICRSILMYCLTEKENEEEYCYD